MRRTDMPGGLRKLSDSGICHITARGTGKQRIFHDEKDRHTFPEGLRKCKNSRGFTLNAYCLTPKHLRLLLREGKESGPIGKIMRGVGARYVSDRQALRLTGSGSCASPAPLWRL